MARLSVWQTIRADLLANVPECRGVFSALGACLFCAGLQVAVLWRISHRLAYAGKGIRLFARLLSYLLARFFSVYISPTAQIGAGLALPHPTGIVIGDKARLGDNVTVYQNVTIGQTGGAMAYPQIGSHVVLYAGAVLIGGIELGDHAVVGANAVVLRSFPSHARIAGVPARELRAAQTAAEASDRERV